MHLSARKFVKVLQIWNQHCADRADVNALKSGKTNEYEYLIRMHIVVTLEVCFA